MTDRCPVCRSQHLEAFFTASELPALCNALWPDAASAAAAASGDIALAVCTDCGMITNTSFDPGVFGYSPQYENSLHFSPVFQEYATTVARRLVERYDLNGVQILEIGPGTGDFLALLCELGDSTGIGYDPSHDPSRAAELDGRVSIRAEDFPTDGSSPARLVCARHVLEHVADPRVLLASMRRSLDGPDAVAYIEVPDGGFLVGSVALWDVIYEHSHHFTAPALHRLLGGIGLTALDTGSSFGDQFLWAEARTGEPSEQPADGKAIETIVADAHDFGLRSGRLLDRAAEIVAARAALGPLVLWGAGSKGVSFLNMVEGVDAVAGAVDINPHKRGLHIPGSGHRVIAPEDLATTPPATALVLNPLYVDEIGRRLGDLGLATEVATLPAA